MSKHLVSVAFAVIWLLLVGGLGWAYAVGEVRLGTLLSFEVLAVALGIVAAIFWKKATHPPESVEEVLYRTEHPAGR